MHATEVLALSEQLPDVVLKDYRKWTSITFRGKGFGWVNHVDDTATIKSTNHDREAMVATDPATFSEGWASGSTAWVSIALAQADEQEVFEILADAWRMTATKKAVAAYDAATGQGTGQELGRRAEGQ